jgi:hypothetical protein
MDHGTQCPIYHQVSNDLDVFPLAMRRRTHASFMAEHRQEEWLAGALLRMYHPPHPPNVKRKPTRKQQRSRS